jgi:putative aldouronate transport system substrate-binding protein
MSPRLSRRELIQWTAALGGTAVLEACAPAVQTPRSGTPTGATSASVLPSYQPLTTGPKPDFPAANQMLCDGFSKYPANPAKALPNDPPGAGGTVTIFSDAALPLPTPVEQNPAWQAVNKALNANVQYTIAANADYPAKLATLMAGSASSKPRPRT